MRREQAQAIMSSLGKLSECVNQLTDDIETIEDHAEQRGLRKLAAPILMAHFDLFEAVVREFPDLDPLKDD